MKRRFWLLSVIIVLALAFAGCESVFFLGNFGGGTDDPTLSSIDIATDPARISYFEGEMFDPDGMEVFASYSDGGYEEIDLEDCTYSPARPLETGDTQVTVSYMNKSDTVDITVSASTLSRIEVVKAPDKTTYLEGETFDPAGMEIKAFKNNGTSEDVDLEDCTFSPDRPLELSDTKITISYMGATCPIAISVQMLDIGDEYFSSEFDTTICSFYDNFDGDTLDDTKWTHMIGNGQIDPDTGEYREWMWGWGNNELQSYQSENTTIANGVMTITAKKESGNGGPQYTSSRIRTKGKFSQTYGRIEARIKLPKGTGMWPAFWMLPESDVYGGWPMSGEIDIMEARGREPDRVDNTVHFGNTWPQNLWDGNSYTFPNGGEIDDWHIYAIEWSEGNIKWFVDGVLSCEKSTSDWWTAGADGSANPNAPFDQEFHILLNLAVGGNYDGGREPDANFTSAAMQVDFVRAYTLENNPW